MKHCIFIFILILSCAFSGCKAQNGDSSGLSLTLVDTLTIKLPYNDASLSNTILYSDGEKEYLLGMVWRKNTKNTQDELLIYNLSDTQMVGINPINKAFRNTVLGIGVFTLDSILLCFNGADNFEAFEDSSLIIVNAKGDLIKLLDVKNLPVRSSFNPLPYDSVVTFFPIYSYRLPCVGNKVILPFRRSEINRPIAKQYPLPIVGELAIHSGSFTPFNTIVHPEYIYDNPYARNYPQPKLSESLTQTILVTFGYSPVIVEYDNVSGSVYTHPVSSVLMDSILASPVNEKGEIIHQNAIERDYGEFLRVIPDAYNNRYAFLITLPYKFGSSNKTGKNKTGLILIDEKFKNIGEGILPDDYSVVGFIKQGLLLKKSVNTGEVVFAIYRINEANSPLTVLPLQSDKKGFEQYIKNNFDHILGNHRTVVISTGVHASCTNCIRMVDKAFGVKSDKPVYLNYIFYDAKESEGYFTKSQQESGKYLPDTYSNFKEYEHNHINPIAYFFQGAKLITTKQMTPANESETILEINRFVTEK